MYLEISFVLIPGPERSPIRDPENRVAAVAVAGKVRDILVGLKDKRKARIEERRQKGLLRVSGERKRVSYEDVAEKVARSAEEVTRLQEQLFTNVHKLLETTNDHNSVTSDRCPTKLERFEKAVLDGESEILPRLRGIYGSARAIAFRPTVRRQSQLRRRQNGHLVLPQTKNDSLGQPVESAENPLGKVTSYVMENNSTTEAGLPRWVMDILGKHEYKITHVRRWIEVIQAPNLTEATKFMEGEVKWPQFLVQHLLHSSAARSQGELVKLFWIVNDNWESFDQDAKIGGLFRLAHISANYLPGELPRVLALLTATHIQGQSELRVFNDVLGIIANACYTKAYRNSTSTLQRRDLIDESMITLLARMAETHVHVKVSTLRKVAAAKLAEDPNAAILILRLAEPRKGIDLMEDLKGKEEDMALAHELAKAESQLSALEREFLMGRLSSRLTSKEISQRLNTIQNWRISAQETFSAWLEFLERRKQMGVAPKEAWAAVLEMCHDEWTFPTAFWEEAFELMEEDNVLPDTTLLCLVLKGIKEVDVLDRILETATTKHQQRLNDKIWQTYLQKLSIENAPRALEIFLNAHTTDTTSGSMDTLDIVYWNILLNGLSNESRRTNDLIWVTRAFDLLAEMERLSIFPSQQTLLTLCTLGDWAGDRVIINGLPAWKAAVEKWHDWIIRPEDFGYKFKLPGIARLVPAHASWRKFIRLAGNHGEYNEVFDATWAMVRFGVQPDWETLLDVDMYMQFSGDEERTLAVREMFREWLGRYPSPREVISHYRKRLRREIQISKDREIQMLEKLEEPEAAVAQQIEGPRSTGDVLPEVEIQDGNRGGAVGPSGKSKAMV